MYFRHVIIVFIIVAIATSFGLIMENDTRIRRQSSDQDSDGKGCILPKHPTFGYWRVFDNSSSFLPGMTVGSGTVLLIRCSDNYKLDGDTAILCTDNRWTANVGFCLRTCPSVTSTKVMRVTCTFNNKRREDCIDAVQGTNARFECVDFYEEPSLRRNLVHVCTNGKWSYNIPECVPVCGQNVLVKPTLIVNGQSADLKEFPWQAALYSTSDNTLLCGGSLVNPRVVLTAAHCVSAERGSALPKEEFFIGVGKYYRRHDHPSDASEAQFSKIREVFLPRQYKGDVQNYFGDIAVLVTQKTFVLSASVQPVCVDWEFRHQGELADQHGYVSGWGYTVQHEHPSDVLKKLEVPLIAYDTCIKDLPEDYDRYMTDDKMCAGFLNSSSSVCRGDSGGGLVVKYDKRFFLRGIVSVSPLANTAEGGCDSQQYGLYTNVSYYISNFILVKEAQFKPCDGKGNCQDETAGTEGEFCKLGTSVGTCKYGCGSSVGENVASCGYNMLCCPLAGDLGVGARSAAQCFKYYGGQRGSIKEEIYPLGAKAQPSQFPHMVRVYQLQTSVVNCIFFWVAVGVADGDGVRWVCGGTLISEKFVLTTAHCIPSSEVGPTKWVRLGRLDVNDKLDTKSDIRVKTVTTNPDYTSRIVYNDIAILELEKEVVFTDSIAPACLHLKDSPFGKLQIIGWGATDWSRPGGPDLLFKGYVDVINHEECQKRYHSLKRRLPKGIINETQICAGPPSLFGTCQGDFGGPLQYWTSGLGNMQSHFVLAGITSTTLCHSIDSSSIYTRISAYIRWIESVVWP